MNTFFNQFRSHITAIIRENNDEFASDLEQAENIDEMVSVVGGHMGLDNQEAINYMVSLI